MSKLKHLSKERVNLPNQVLDTRAIQTSLDKLVDNSNACAAHVLSNARVIKDVVVATGATTIVQHGLGRELQGYIIILQTSDLPVYDLQATNVRKTTELWLTGAGVFDNSTISLLVF